MTESNNLILGYDLHHWNNFALKKEISVDISRQTNSHILLAGMSGSGKSYSEFGLIAKLILAEPDGEFYFADYKRRRLF